MAKVNRSKIAALAERFYHKEQHMKSLPHVVQKLWDRLKFLKM